MCIIIRLYCLVNIFPRVNAGAHYLRARTNNQHNWWPTSAKTYAMADYKIKIARDIIKEQFGTLVEVTTNLAHCPVQPSSFSL